jgi:hypothetical protein
MLTFWIPFTVSFALTSRDGYEGFSSSSSVIGLSSVCSSLEPLYPPNENNGRFFFGTLPTLAFSFERGATLFYQPEEREKKGRFSLLTCLRLLFNVLNNVFSTMKMLPSSSPTINISMIALCHRFVRIQSFFLD